MLLGALYLESSVHIMASKSWSAVTLQIAAKCDSFNTSPDSSQRSCVGLYCCGIRIGLIKPSILPHLLSYKDVFVGEEVEDSIVAVKLSDRLLTVEERTKSINAVLKDLQSTGVFPCLQGWRNENYAVATQFGRPALFHCERAGARLLGVYQYGVHLNGYVQTENGEYLLWVARRSVTKATYPGMLDNMVAGGIAAGTGAFESLVKECVEEASISADLATSARATGTISYFHEAPDGLEPETEFIYELQLPLDFVPSPQDGEVSEFYLWDVEKVKSEIAKEAFKPNCALVLLQFFIQHGLLSPSEEPEYARLCCCAHVDVYSREQAP